MSTYFLRQQVEFILNEVLDLFFPCCGISVFRVAILCDLVSLIEVVTQILAGIDTGLDQLGFVSVQVSSLREQCPTGYTSVLTVNCTEWCSRKVNQISKPAHVAGVLRVLHEIAHELGNRKIPPRDDELTRITNTSETFLRPTGVSGCKVGCEPKTVRSMPLGQACVLTNVQPQRRRISDTPAHVECVSHRNRMDPMEDRPPLSKNVRRRSLACARICSPSSPTFHEWHSQDVSCEHGVRACQWDL